jgi:FkbM family methyltransferase
MAPVRDRFVSTLKALGLYPIARRAVDSLARVAPMSQPARGRLLDLYRQFVEPDDLCFDVGANMGNRTELFLALGARVVAVEPQPSCLRALRRRYGSDARVTLVGQALGREPGTAEMFVSDAHPISSLSPEWVGLVEASGRFGAHSWDERVRVPITTLDELIDSHGEPAFCKIDVEGYEAEVLAGLSRPLRHLSFEFTPEHPDGALACVDRLCALGHVLFNYSSGDSGELELAEWVGPEEIGRRLAAFAPDAPFGDVYVRGLDDLVFTP